MTSCKDTCLDLVPTILLLDMPPGGTAKTPGKCLRSQGEQTKETLPIGPAIQHSHNGSSLLLWLHAIFVLIRVAQSQCNALVYKTIDLSWRPQPRSLRLLLLKHSKCLLSHSCLCMDNMTTMTGSSLIFNMFALILMWNYLSSSYLSHSTLGSQQQMDPCPIYDTMYNTTDLPITMPLPGSHTVPFMPPLYHENTTSRDLLPQYPREFGFRPRLTFDADTIPPHSPLPTSLGSSDPFNVPDMPMGCTPLIPAPDYLQNSLGSESGSIIA